MKTSTKIILSIVLALVVVGIVYYEVSPRSQLAGAGSPVGSTNSTARIAQIVTSNLTSTTYASFLNSDASDRIVTSVQFLFTGYGASPLTTLYAGTSTTAVGTSTTNYLLSNVSISTTTDPVFFSASQISTAASTTVPISSNAQRIWTAGSYLNFVTNATSTGYGTIRVEYLAE